MFRAEDILIVEDERIPFGVVIMLGRWDAAALVPAGDEKYAVVDVSLDELKGLRDVPKKDR